MLWVGAGFLFLLVSAVSVFLYLSSDADKETKKKNAEFQGLLEFARVEKDVEKILLYAGKTRFSEITVYKMDSSTPVLTQSLAPGNDFEAVRKIILDLKRGKANLSDPEDNPLMYTRPFLQIEFEGNTVVKVEPRNIG